MRILRWLWALVSAAGNIALLVSAGLAGIAATMATYAASLGLPWSVMLGLSCFLIVLAVILAVVQRAREKLRRPVPELRITCGTGLDYIGNVAPGKDSIEALAGGAPAGHPGKYERVQEVVVALRVSEVGGEAPAHGVTARISAVDPPLPPSDGALPSRLLWKGTGDRERIDIAPGEHAYLPVYSVIAAWPDVNSTIMDLALQVPPGLAHVRHTESLTVTVEVLVDHQVRDSRRFRIEGVNTRQPDGRYIPNPRPTAVFEVD